MPALFISTRHFAEFVVGRVGELSDVVRPRDVAGEAQHLVLAAGGDCRDVADRLVERRALAVGDDQFQAAAGQLLGSGEPDAAGRRR